MKIVSIAAAADGLVTVAFRVAPSEALEEGDVARIFELAREISGEGHPRGLPVEYRGSMEKLQNAREIPGVKSVSGAAPEAPANPTAPAAASASTEPASDAGAPSRRRRQSSTSTEPSAPIAGRRRRTVDGADEQPQEAAPEAQPVPTEQPRRRRAAQTASPAPAPSATASATADDKISDADLLKAASRAAAVLTPKPVKELVAEFGAEKVNDIPAPQRRAFLDKLAKTLEKAKG